MFPHTSVPEYKTLSEPVEHPLNGVCTVPLKLPMLLHAPSNVAATAVNPGASSQVMLTTGQVIVAGPAPVTLTVQVWLIVLPHTSVPEYKTLIEPVEHPLNGVCTIPLKLPLLLHAPANVAATGLNPGASSQVMLTTGQVLLQVQLQSH